MDWISNFIEGAMTGLGMWLMMTILGILSYFFLKNRITKWAAKLWTDIKSEAVKLDGVTITGKLKKEKKK